MTASGGRGISGLGISFADYQLELCSPETESVNPLHYICALELYRQQTYPLEIQRLTNVRPVFNWQGIENVFPFRFLPLFEFLVSLIWVVSVGKLEVFFFFWIC